MPVQVERLPAREPRGAPPFCSVQDGRHTPRETRLSGNHPPTNARFQQSLRQGDGRKDVFRRRASSAPRSRRDDVYMGGSYNKAADKAEDKDGEWRCGSYRYANSLFYNQLRSWDGQTDIAMRTPKDWRVSTEETLGLGGTAFGHDLTTNNADDWKRASPIWVEKQFRGNMNNYPGRDVGLDEEGHVHFHRTKKMMGDTIWREKKQASRLTTARADETFLGSLRSAGCSDGDEYRRRRARLLNLPSYEALSAEQRTKAKRAFANLDANGDGVIDAEELRRFLKSCGHRVGAGAPKQVKQLIAAAEEGVSDAKLQVKEFARLYNGLKLDA